jgi:hypothetical protein
MLGWHISVYRQRDGGGEPATFESSEGPRLAVWQTDVSGLDWIDDLVKAKKAIDLGGNGYPMRFTAHAEDVIPQLVIDPPHAHHTWILQVGDVVGPEWAGRTVIDDELVDNCRPDEWLLIEAWDES